MHFSIWGNHEAFEQVCPVCNGRSGLRSRDADDASAAPTSEETLETQIEAVDTSTMVDTAANETLAIEISESLLEADSPESYFDGLSESEKEVFTA